jgi:Protein of unknown function (DUF3307)
MSLTPFESGLIAHLVADWIFQNDWMARNKMSLRHPASWTHAAIQGLCLGLALGWLAGLVLGVAHLLIDTRVFLVWWMRSFKKCHQAPDASSIATWLDQTLHILCLALWVALT